MDEPLKKLQFVPAALQYPQKLELCLSSILSFSLAGFKVEFELVNQVVIDVELFHVLTMFQEVQIGQFIQTGVQEGDGGR